MATEPGDTSAIKREGEAPCGASKESNVAAIVDSEDVEPKPSAETVEPDTAEQDASGVHVENNGELPHSKDLDSAAEGNIIMSAVVVADDDSIDNDGGSQSNVVNDDVSPHFDTSQPAIAPASPDSSTDGSDSSSEELMVSSDEKVDNNEAVSMTTTSAASHGRQTTDHGELATDKAAAPGSPDSLDSGSSLESRSSMETQASDGSVGDDDLSSPISGTTKSAIHSKDDGDDVTSRAAIALAAVAVAANAQHSSPSAAAQAARALAPGIMPGAGMSPRRNEDMKVVSLDNVKHFMRMKTSNSTVLQKLAEGENDAFLQHLLLLEFFRVDEEPEPDVPKSPSAGGEDKAESYLDGTIKETGVFDEELAALAAERVRCILGVIGGAYSSMVGLLPEYT